MNIDAPRERRRRAHGSARGAALTLLLLVPFALVPMTVAEGCPCSILLSLDDVAADTFVVKLEVEGDPGAGFEVLEGSRMFVRGHHTEPKVAVAMSFGWTDLESQRTAVALYAESRGPMEVHASGLAGTPLEQSVHLNEQGGGYTSASITNTFGGGVTFGRTPLYLVLAVPEASFLEVEFNMHFDRPVTVSAQAHSYSGAVVRAVDFEGAAQVTTVPAAAAVAMSFSAEAPQGTRGFAFLGPALGTWGAMSFGIDAPGDWGAYTVEFVPPGGWSSKIGIAGGPPGSYEHRFDAMLRVQETNLLWAPLPGAHAIFYAAPMPL